MIVRNSRNWLRPARAIVLPAATLVFAPAALAQPAPVPPVATSAQVPGTATAPSHHDLQARITFYFKFAKP